MRFEVDLLFHVYTLVGPELALASAQDDLDVIHGWEKQKKKTKAMKVLIQCIL